MCAMPDGCIVNQRADEIVLVRGVGGGRCGRYRNGLDYYGSGCRSRHILHKLHVGGQGAKQTEMPIATGGCTEMHDAVGRRGGGRFCICHCDG